MKEIDPARLTRGRILEAAVEASMLYALTMCVLDGSLQYRDLPGIVGSGLGVFLVFTWLARRIRRRGE